MSAISLTASMRSNLLSLQNIASRQDIVQNRLATGLKVSSAIDNPSSYYTASSLNNRAADLTALLDAMSQGVQTIKAASEAIDAGTKFLEQAKAVANQALETAQPVIARVSNEAELLAAVDSGQRGLIVLDNDIVMTDNQNIVLKEGQSLVGASYLNSSLPKTSLTFNFTTKESAGITMADNSLIAGLDIKYTTDFTPNQISNGGVIMGENIQNITIKDVNINFNTDAVTSKLFMAGIYLHNSRGTVTGDINITGSGTGSRAISSYVGSQLTIDNARLNINSSASGIITAYRSAQTVINNSKVNISLDTSGYYGIYNLDNSSLSVTGNSLLNIYSSAGSSYGINNDTTSGVNLADFAKLNINHHGATGIRGISGGYLNLSGQAQANVLTTGTGANIYTTTLTLLDNARLNIRNTGLANGIERATLNIKNNGRVNIDTSHDNAAAFVKGTVNAENNALINITTAGNAATGIYSGTDGIATINLLSANVRLNINTIGTTLNFYGTNTNINSVAGAILNINGGLYTQNTPGSVSVATGNTLPAPEFDRRGDFENFTVEDITAEVTESFNADFKISQNTDIKPSGFEQFSQIISQYDSLIQDSVYKGVNLLSGQNLKINFNEDRSSKIDITGVKADSQNLGLTISEWASSADVENSVSELETAVNSLRSFASQFGNYYSIVTTRQDFTENLINVLEEGSDKLTLADMNQESANMLALQTSQQLAVNSLSLASQASQSILRLF